MLETAKSKVLVMWYSKGCAHCLWEVVPLLLSWKDTQNQMADSTELTNRRGFPGWESAVCRVQGNSFNNHSLDSRFKVQLWSLSAVWFGRCTLLSQAFVSLFTEEGIAAVCALWNGRRTEIMEAGDQRGIC